MLLIEKLQSYLSNREIAYIFWALVLILVLFICKKNILISFLNETLNILFKTKFLILFLFVILSLLGSVKILKYLNCWDTSLVKDTIMWHFFNQLPFLIGSITKAKDNLFFKELLKQNIQIGILIAYLQDFWVLPLIYELIIIPIMFIGYCVYSIAIKEKYYILKNLLEKITIYIGVLYLIYLTYNTIKGRQQLLTVINIKALLLPLELLILNLPLFYGLSLYSKFEELFVFLKGCIKQRIKMKWIILKYSKLSLYKLSILREFGIDILIESISPRQLSYNLIKFECFINSRIGDNYMKRSNYYIFCNIFLMIISLLVIIFCNSKVSLYDMVRFKFVLDINKFKIILTDIFIVSLVFSLYSLIYCLGFKKQQYEDLTKIKKLALSKLIVYIKSQNNITIVEKYSDEDIQNLFHNFISPLYKLHEECCVVIRSYDNLVSRYELFIIKKIELISLTILSYICHDTSNFINMSEYEFVKLFQNKITTSPKTESFNVFINTLNKDIKKYQETITTAKTDFKYLF